MASLSELPRATKGAYTCFALALFVALGSYQFITPVKQALFFDLVGTRLEPLAKSMVLVVLIPTLLAYGALFTAVQDPKWLMLFVGGFFGLCYLAVALVLGISGGRCGAWLAWLLYYVTECRAVIMMPMIWSIVNDVTSPETAKAAYPLIFFVIQIGGICGSFVAVHVRTLGGTVGLLIFQAACIVAVVGLTWLGCVLTGDEPRSPEEQLPLNGGQQVPPGNQPAEPAPNPKKKVVDGSFIGNFLYQAVEGLWLLLTRPYAFMTFWVSYATLMPRTALDYTNGVIVHQTYPHRDDQVAFWGRMSLTQSICTAALTLLGTKTIVEKLGLGKSLLVLPIVMMGAVLAVCVHDNLWVTSTACIVASVVAYGLNSPCKEMLYIRTSREIKYKAKSWSEMYGNEVMKLLGSQINLWVNNDRASCRPNCFHEVPTVAIVGVWVGIWLLAARRLGNEHRMLEEKGQIVE